MNDPGSIVKALRREPLWTHGPERVQDGAPAPSDLLPHRPPFLLIDSVDGIDRHERVIRGRRWLDAADPVFAGHFPGQPVYPGVLQIEMMGQLAICLAGLLAAGTAGGQLPRIVLTKVLHAEFFEALRPNDSLTLHASVIEDDGLITRTAGQVFKGSALAAVCVQEGCYVD